MAQIIAEKDPTSARRKTEDGGGHDRSLRDLKSEGFHFFDVIAARRIHPLLRSLGLISRLLEPTLFKLALPVTIRALGCLSALGNALLLLLGGMPRALTANNRVPTLLKIILKKQNQPSGKRRRNVDVASLHLDQRSDPTLGNEIKATVLIIVRAPTEATLVTGDSDSKGDKTRDETCQEPGSSSGMSHVHSES
ncbi:hypothetical protein B0H19DRAFT_1274342 [Mycena capillaripes]|nr:hypothetical protein B0H19DRAFT_1274342 [Mycena capillaripes]